MRQRIDFNYVPLEHRAIDERLHNWGRWCHDPYTAGCSPMFRMTPPPPRVRSETEVSSVDVIDAEKIQKAFKRLPQVLRLVLLWCYVKRTQPGRICKEINVSMDRLAQFLYTARDELSIQHTK